MLTEADEIKRVGKLDPIFKFAFDNLPDRIQRGIEAGNPHAVKRLYAEYERLRTGAPNRAARRAKRSVT